MKEQALATIRELVEQVATEQEDALVRAIGLAVDGQYLIAKDTAQTALDRMAEASEDSGPSAEERREHDKWL